jgi:hypothetical protein
MEVVRMHPLPAPRRRIDPSVLSDWMSAKQVLPSHALAPKLPHGEWGQGIAPAAIQDVALAQLMVELQRCPVQQSL